MHKHLRRIIGLYELLTGGYGCLWMVYSILLAGGGSLAALLVLCLYILIALAGFSLWNDRPKGRPLSIVAQAVQALSISAGWFHYLVTAGLSLRLVLGGGLHFHHSFDTNFHLGWTSGFGSGSHPFPYELGVNLTALAMLVYLIFSGKNARKST
jgi:hypothetical protein